MYIYIFKYLVNNFKIANPNSSIKTKTHDNYLSQSLL